MREQLSRWIGEHLGRDSEPSVDGARPPTAEIDRRLRREQLVWISAVRPDGTRHLAPTWFSWDGALLWIFAKPGDFRPGAFRDDPRIVLALGEPEEGAAVQLIEGEATLLSTPTAQALTSVHRAKYGDRLWGMNMTWDDYARTYAQSIVVRPTRYLGWPGAVPDPSPAEATALRPIPFPAR
jgi:PPOX class probable F420-dependent enzyme